MLYMVLWIGTAALAAFIAHRKRQSAIGCFFLGLIAPPLGLLAALLISPKSDSGTSNGRMVKLLIGLSPFWLSIAAIAVGSMTDRREEVWMVSPWLIVASVPVSIVLLLLIEVFSALLGKRS